MQTDPHTERMERLRGEWATAVGGLIMAFGDIEYGIRHGLENIPQDTLGNAVADLPLGRRIQVLESVLQGRDRSSGRVNRILDALSAARNHSETRNLVAHNPLSLELFFESEGEIPRVESAVAHPSKPFRRVTLEEVDAQRAEIEDLVRELWHAILCYIQDEIEPSST